VGRLTVAGAAAAVAAAIAVAVALPSEDDEPVAASDPRAREAVAVAREVVPGRVVGVHRDRDNGKWEVTIRQGDTDYEVELDPADLGLLRVDYD
jgi:uncharacterized membrane protein YkoI